MNEFERFTADVHNTFELLGGKKSYDSFLALISASARQDEQERIIRLLEQHLPKAFHLSYEVSVDITGLYDPDESVFIADGLIALIKGENNDGIN